MAPANDDTTTGASAGERPVSYEFLPNVRQGYRPAREFDATKSGSRLDSPLQGRSKVGVKLNLEGRRKDGSGWEDLAVSYDEDEETFTTYDRESDATSLGKHLGDDDQWTDISADEIAEVGIDIRMFGPGDVAGIDDEQVVRVHPEPETQRMPSNYFPHVEFMRPDMPWLFSPERADDEGRARPWLALVVVERAAATSTVDGSAPLERLTVPQNQLPPQDELWAWAHVQTSHYPDAHAGDPPHYLGGEQAARRFTKPNAATSSRLLCPRRPAPETEYVAAVIPTFEPGRLAGLGREPYRGDGQPTLGPAWDHDSEDEKTFPVYYSWRFTSGRDEDFESLVRKLEARDLSADEYAVGVREVDASDPGPLGLRDTSVDGEITTMGGALKAGDLTNVPRYPGPKRALLETMLEEPEAYAQSTNRRISAALARLAPSNNTFPLVDGSSGPNAPNDVPVVGPPIYGRWHAMRKGVPDAGTPVDWVRQLNLDPRWRIAAGFGTSVVRENQDEYMRRAWQQFGPLRAANRETKRRETGSSIYDNLADRIDRYDVEGALADQIGANQFDHRTIEELNRAIAASEAVDDFGVGPGDLGGDSGVVDQVGGAVGDSSGGATFGPESGVVDDWIGGVQLDGWNRVEGAAGSRDLTMRNATARFENRSSTAFRQLTRTGGKLDAKAGTDDVAAEPLSLESGVDSGDRPTAVSEASDQQTDSVTEEPLAGNVTTLSDLGVSELPESRLQQVTSEASESVATGDATPEATAETGESAPQQGATPLRGTLEAPKDAIPDSADWRVDENGELMTLSETVTAVDDELRPVPKALVQLEGTQRHCSRARQDLEATLESVRDGDHEALRSALTAEPTLSTVSRAIRQNTFDAVDRQFSKLLVAPPEPVSDELTASKKDELLDTMRDYHDDLLVAVDSARAATQDGVSEDEVALHLTEATRAIDSIEATIEVLWGYVDTGTHLLRDPVVTDETEQRQSAVETPLADEPTQPLSAGPETPDPAVTDAIDDQLGPTTVETVAPETIRAAEHQLALSTQLSLFEQTQARDGTPRPALLDGTGWTVQSASESIHPMMAKRDKPLAKVMAAPAFDDATYRALKALDQEYLLPGVEEIPRNTIGALVTNPPFIEAFMCGLNHEMGAELLYRRYPTDRRGTHFRQFWDYTTGSKRDESGESADDEGGDSGDEEPSPRYDITEIHEWRARLGNNFPTPADDEVGGEKVVPVVRGELLKMYPRTRIYAAKAIQRNPVKEQFRGDGIPFESADDMIGGEEDRIPLLEPVRQRMLATIDRRDDNPFVYQRSEIEAWGTRQPIFEGHLDPDVRFFGFDLGPDAAVGRPLDVGAAEYDPDDLGWFFVFEEPMGETRFGLDNAGVDDGGAIPDGIVHGGDNYESITEDSREVGWSGLSWGHLVDVDSGAGIDTIDEKLGVKSHVEIRGDRPWNGEDEPWRVDPDRDERLDETAAATWGRNSAHMARITWQLPVRAAVHADDLLPNSAGSGGTATPDGGWVVDDPDDGSSGGDRR